MWRARSWCTSSATPSPIFSPRSSARARSPAPARHGSASGRCSSAARFPSPRRTCRTSASSRRASCAEACRSAFLVLSVAEQHLLRLLAHRAAAHLVLEELQPLLHGRPRVDRVEPALQVRIVLELLSLALVGPDPGEHGDVGDRVLSREIGRSEEHTSELQSRENLVCRLLLEK